MPRVRSGAEGPLWPALLAPAPARLLALQAQLADSQWWPADELRAAQFMQADALLDHARRTVPWYRQRGAQYRCASPIDPARWRELPILSRAQVQQAGAALYSDAPPPAHGKPHEIRTSGSTGRPVCILGSGLSQLFWLAFTLRDHLWHGRDLRGKLAAIRPDRRKTTPAGIFGNGWGPATDTIYETGPSALLHSSYDVGHQLDWLLEVQPDYLISLPSNLRELARRLPERARRLDRLRQIRSFGEVLAQTARDTIEAAFGVPVIDAYSTAETGYLALECPEGSRLHLQSESALVEILDADGEACTPGQIGRVVVTPLHNYATPLIRYAVGDQAVAGTPCSCGRGLPTVERVLGRERNMLRLPDGTTHYPSFPAELWASIGKIEQIQLVQTRLDRVEVRLVAPVLTGPEATRLTRVLQESLRFPFELPLVYLPEIPRTAGGKYEDFVSAIKPQL